MVNLRLIIEFVILVTLCYPIINGPPSELKNCLLFHVAGIFILLCCVVNFVIDKIISKLRTNANENKKDLNSFKVESAPSQIAPPPPASDKLKRFNERKRIRRQKAAEAEKQLELLFAEAEKNNKILNEFREKSALSQIAPFSAQAQDLSQSNQLEQALSIPEAKQVSSANISAIDRSEEIKERVTSNFKIKQNANEDLKQKLEIISAEIEENRKELNKCKVKLASSQIAPHSARVLDARLKSQHCNQLEQEVTIQEAKQVSSTSEAAINRSEEIKEGLTSSAVNCRIKQNGGFPLASPSKEIRERLNSVKFGKRLPSTVGVFTFGPRDLDFQFPLAYLDLGPQPRSTESYLFAISSSPKPATNAAFEMEVEMLILTTQLAHLNLGPKEAQSRSTGSSLSANAALEMEVEMLTTQLSHLNLGSKDAAFEMEVEMLTTQLAHLNLGPKEAQSIVTDTAVKQDKLEEDGDEPEKIISQIIDIRGTIRRKADYFNQISGQSGISIFGRMLDNKSGKLIPKSSNHADHSPLGKVNNLAVIPWVPQSIPPSSHPSVAQWVQSHQSTAPLYPSNFTGKIASMGKMN